MPDSPRQKFIIKINQCINLLNRVDGYLNKINDFVKESEFYYTVYNIRSENQLIIDRLKDFLGKVNSNGSFLYKRRG